MADGPRYGNMRDLLTSVPRSSHGNTPEAEAYGREMKQLLRDYAARAPRTLQRHLGPSEIGEPCTRQVVGKMSCLSKVNHVTDPWASVMGTAGHAYVEEMYRWDNVRRLENGMPVRWVPEQRVCPDPDPVTKLPAAFSHPGTADLYDIPNRMLVDHKFLGDSSRAKLKAHGPKRVYYVQLLLYRRGYQYLGLPVDKIALLAWPRTKSSLDEFFCWLHVPTQEDEELVDQVLKDTAARQQMAELVKAGHVTLNDIPATPSDDSCAWCPYFRPQTAYDGGFGCAGTSQKRS